MPSYCPVIFNSDRPVGFCARYLARADGFVSAENSCEKRSTLWNSGKCFFMSIETLIVQLNAHLVNIGKK